MSICCPPFVFLFPGFCLGLQNISPWGKCDGTDWRVLNDDVRLARPHHGGYQPGMLCIGFLFSYFSSQEASVTVWSGLMDALLNSSDGAKRSSCILLIFWLLVVSSSIFASSSFCFLPWRGFRLLRKTSADENWSLNNKVLPPFNANSIFSKGVDSKKLERQFWTSSSTRKKETLGRSLPWVVRIAVIFPILKGEREWKDLKVCSCESTELEKQFPSLLLFQQCREKSTFLFPSLGTFSCFCFSSFFFFLLPRRLFRAEGGHQISTKSNGPNQNCLLTRR